MPWNPEIDNLDLAYFKDLSVFKLSDLIGKTVKVREFKDENTKLIFATDLKSGEIFVLKEETRI